MIGSGGAVTDGELRALTHTLQAAGSPCVALDGEGVAAIGAPSGPHTGDPIATWIPDWRADGEPLRAVDGRWIVSQRLAAGESLTLVLLLDRTGEQVEEEARLLAARREALGELAGATAREMNDPMTIVQGRLELLRAFGLADAEAAQRHCAIALEHAHRLSGTLHNLRLVGASAGASLDAVSLSASVTEAVDGAGLEPERVRIDLHPADLRVVGQSATVARVLAGVLRALAGGGRESVSLQARSRAGRVAIDVVASGRRRHDVDTLPLGLVTALLDSLGGALRFTGTGLQVELCDAGAAGPSLDQRGDLLVVGDPRLVERVGVLLDGHPLSVRGESSAEAAVGRLRSSDLVGVVSELLLPGRSGFAFRGEVARVRPDLPLPFLLVTPEPISRLPPDVRVLTAPLTRERLVAALARPI